MDQDLGRPRGIGYTIMSGQSHPSWLSYSRIWSL